jgi:hypothetical protein
MRKSRHLFSKFLLVLLLAVATFGAFWFGLVPQRYSPFSPISLERPPGFFLDAKLAALRHDPALCQAVLKQPHIDATSIPDRTFKNGCGWANAVRFSTTGGAKIGVENLTCEMAAAMTLWMEYDVQPLAQEMFGQPVTGLGDFGTYDCRNIIGNPIWKGTRSQHASANALDISSFTFADGRQISVLKDWPKNTPEGRFLHEAHSRACRYFRVALGPNFNEAHKNHFHFDRGLMWTCR